MIELFAEAAEGSVYTWPAVATGGVSAAGILLAVWKFCGPRILALLDGAITSYQRRIAAADAVIAALPSMLSSQHRKEMLLEAIFDRQEKGATKTLLIIEDNQSDYDLIIEWCKDLFNEYNAIPLQATTLEMAGRYWGKADCVLADAGLPDADYAAVLRFANANGKKVVMYSGSAENHAVEAAARAAGVEIIPKTTDPEPLRDVVRELLG